ncbi:F-box protein skip5 [Ranunculus cassubicifolius]
MEDDLKKRNTDCVYFLASPLTCKKGMECEFRHSEIARLNTTDCWYWLSGSCLNPTCAFRHTIGGGDLPDDTVLVCSQGSDSALEVMSTCKVANLTVKAELGCCLLHRSGRLTIEGCILQCEENPLDYLSCPIVSTSNSPKKAIKEAYGDRVSVSQTRIEGGNKAVSTIGTLALQRVRVIYTRNAIFFWFDIDHK